MTDYVDRPLTDRQREILTFIARHLREHGYAPSLRDICDQTGIASTNGVLDHLNALSRKGYLTRDLATARSLRLTDRGKDEVEE